MPFTDVHLPTYAYALKVCNDLFPNHRVISPSYILSEAGCEQQVAHCDMPCGNRADAQFGILSKPDEIPPLSAIVVFEKTSSFVLWDNSHRAVWNVGEFVDEGCPPIQSRTITLPRYSILVFRQDLVHCGCGYAVGNVRVHFYLNRDDFEHIENVTQHVDTSYFVT